MNYRIEWLGGAALVVALPLLLIVPEFALLAVLVIAMAAVVALLALAAAALISPYLLVRGLRHRRARRTTRQRTGGMRLPSAIPAVQSLHPQPRRPEPALRSAALHASRTEDPPG